MTRHFLWLVMAFPLVAGSVRADQVTLEEAASAQTTDGAVTPERVAVAVAVESSQADEEDEEERYFEDLRLRRKLAPIHRILGISTWASMTATVVLGAIRYHDRYGFFAGRDDNPCARGTAVFGVEGCLGSPLPHLISSIATTALYTATLSLSFFMPDPDQASIGDSDDASRLRTHKVLRWVHLGAMVAQVILGPIMSRVGDRTNDYGVHQALATTHMALGLVGYGALTWAGALML